METEDKKLQDKTKETYENIGRLMADGITKGKELAENAAKEGNRNLLLAEAHYLEEKKRLEEEYEAAEEARNQRAYQIKLQKAKTQEQAETARINESLRLQKKANEAYLEALKESLEKEEELIKAQKERITEDFEAIVKSASDSVGELNKARENMAEKMVKYGGLFQEQRLVFANSGPGGTPEIFDDALLDLKTQRQELEEYAGLLKEIQSHEEVPPEMLDAILKLSVTDAIKYGKAFVQLKPHELKSYIDDWMAIDRLAQETSQESYADETKKALEEIEQELSAWYGSIPEGFFHEGELSAEAFGNAFVKKLQSMREMLEEAVQSVVIQPLESAESFAKKTTGVVNNVQQSMTYVLQGSGETVAEQLQSVRNHAIIEKLRGGYGDFAIRK